MPSIIDTPSYTLTVYSEKAELDKLDVPVGAGKGDELAVELTKRGLTMTGKSESTAVGMFVYCTDAKGAIVRVKITLK